MCVCVEILKSRVCFYPTNALPSNHPYQTFHRFSERLEQKITHPPLPSLPPPCHDQIRRKILLRLLGFAFLVAVGLRCMSFLLPRPGFGRIPEAPNRLEHLINDDDGKAKEDHKEPLISA